MPREMKYLFVSPLLILLFVQMPSPGQGITDGTAGESAEHDWLYLAQQPGQPSPTPPPATAPTTPSDRQPPQRATRPTRRSDRTSLLASRSPVARLASIPNMYGDFFFSGGQVSVMEHMSSYEVYGDVPPAGGGGRVKISENNKALPMQRIFFTYNHYQNALDAYGPDVRSLHVDRFTVGIEQPFFDDRCSVELRMPFTDAFGSSTPGSIMEGGNFGNLAVSVKRLIWRTPTWAAAIGLGIDLPTGSDVTGRAGSAAFVMHNDAVHLLPYIGFLSAPNDRFFYQGFLQVDVATNGNRIDFVGANLGKLDDQNLLYLDMAAGYWLCRYPQATRFKGLASVLELHYTSTLQDSDVVTTPQGAFDTLNLSNSHNRVDVLNLTVGLHAEVGQTTFRIGGVFPLRTGSDKQFDSEIVASVNRRY